MISVNVLQYGAIGIGLAVLAYTAAALKQELARPKPRPEGRNLILMFMAFSLVAFCIATYIEIQKENANLDSQKQIAEIGNIVSSLDANLGGKYQASLDREDVPPSVKQDLLYFESQLCRNVKALKKLLYGTTESQCRLSQR